MKTHRITSRCAEVLALAMIGEGIVALLRPSRYARFWLVGPKFHRGVVEYLAAHRRVEGLLAVAEICFGLWLALREVDR